MKARIVFLLAFTWASFAHAGPGPQMVQNEGLSPVSSFEKLGQEIQEELRFLSTNVKKCSDSDKYALLVGGNTGEKIKSEIQSLAALLQRSQNFITCRYNEEDNCGEFGHIEAQLRDKVDVQMLKYLDKMRKAFAEDKDYPECTPDYAQKFEVVYKKIQTFKQDFYAVAKVPTKSGTQGRNRHSVPLQKFADARKTHATAN